MAEVYGAVTDRILINLARYFPYVKPGEELPGAFEYQARMLAKMGQVNRDTADIIMQSLDGADAALRGALETAILDALKAVSIPAVEVHISNVDAREPFRQISYPGMYCEKTIKGLGIEGYRQAILYLKEKYGA